MKNRYIFPWCRDEDLILYKYLYLRVRVFRMETRMDRCPIQLTRCSQGYSRHESPTSHVCAIEESEQLAPSSITTTTSATTGFFSASSTSSLFGCPRTWLQTR